MKLIVTDLDNTLLRRDKSISDDTVEVFRRCRERGILIAFATTRSEFASVRFSYRIRPDIFISNGGALARYKGKVLYRTSIPSVLGNRLLHEFSEMEGILEYAVDAENGYFDSGATDKEPEYRIDYTNAKHTDFSRETDFGNVFKIMVRAVLAQNVYDVADRYPELDVINFAGEDWYQVKPIGATKELALAVVCSELGIGLTDAVAFGDDLNDLGMLKSCGRGVAVSNAVAKVKAVADCVCGDCDEDGVARWLERNIL